MDRRSGLLDGRIFPSLSAQLTGLLKVGRSHQTHQRQSHGSAPQIWIFVVFHPQRIEQLLHQFQRSQHTQHEQTVQTQLGSFWRE
jgi:hypothetical protein